MTAQSFRLKPGGASGFPANELTMLRPESYRAAA